MTVFNIISMLGGLALFLYGMRIMGDALKKECSGSFKAGLEKVTGSPVMGFLIGLGLTALIQSATATIVIVSGLVGAGIMSLSSSIGIILGANVGTTVTGQIIRLMDIDAKGTEWLNIFKPATLAPIAAVLGIILIMFVNKKNSAGIGTIAMGFGILFTGLLNMSSSVEPLSESPEFISMFSGLSDAPWLGFLVGFIVAFILQSSSATIGILQALSVTGALTFGAIYPIIMGIYLGDCVTTAIVCSIGTKPDAKRTGLVNILFNLSTIVLIVVVVNILHATGTLANLWNSSLNSGGIANVHTIFKLTCAIVLLPLAKTYEKLSVKLIKEDANQKAKRAEIEGMDEALFKSPALALNSTYRALCRMNSLVCENVNTAIGLVKEYEPKAFGSLDEDEDYLDDLEDSINAYLSKLSPHLSAGLQEEIQNYYLQCVTDFERSGDHVYGIAQCAGELYDKKLQFSDEALMELSKVLEVLNSVLSETTLAFTKQNLDSAKHVEAYVVLIDEMNSKFRNNHVERMKEGICDAVTGSIYLDILMHLGRIADMCSNIAIHTLVRHNPHVDNYEHQYMAALHHGDNEEYNIQLAQLEEKYMK